MVARTKHDIHSPFVFQLLTKAINAKTSSSCCIEIEELRKELLQNKTSILIEDFGAGSKKQKGNIRQISEIARHQSKSARYARLLYRLTGYFQPESILELGTSLGISTAYMAKAAPNAEIITIEGSKTTAEIALENFRKLNITNVKVETGNFDTVLPQLISGMKKPDVVFFDGNHRKQPTLNYFETCLKHKQNETVFIFDDIHWSAEMEEAWETIKKSPDVTVSIDLYFMGLVFFRKECSKEDFVIRF